MKRVIQLRIPTVCDQVLLLDFLCRRFTYHDRAEWSSMIAQGRMSINGQHATMDSRITPGSLLEYHVEEIPEPDVDKRFVIFHQEPDFWVIAKSGRLPCHPSGRYFRHTLWALLKTQYNLPNPTLVHRLDRETSGLIIVGLTPDATRALHRQFAARQVVKRYVVFVEGVFPATVDAQGFLCPDRSSPVRKKRAFIPAEPDCPVPPDGEWAVTSFRGLATRGGVSMVEAHPETGRLHQIRASLHSLGWPVVGDKLYGIDPEAFLRLREDKLTPADYMGLRLERQALHAAGLQFKHPRTGLPVNFETPLPDDMRSLWDRLDRHADR